MALAIQYYPLYTQTGTTRKMRETSASAIAAAREATGLNIVRSSGYSYAWLIGFDGDRLNNTPSGSSTTPTVPSSSNHPCMISIGGLNNSSTSSAGCQLTVYGNTDNHTTAFVPIASAEVSAADGPTLVWIRHGNKTLISIFPADGQAERIFSVLMIDEGSTRRILALKNNGETLAEFYQGGTFDGDAEDYLPYDYCEVTPPELRNDENVVSMAPLVTRTNVYEDVFSPLYMRASKSTAQFEIGSDTFIASGNPISATGAQFVARMPAEVQGE